MRTRTGRLRTRWNAARELENGEPKARASLGLVALVVTLIFGVPAAARAGRVVDIAAGEFHTCALMATGNVKCWGDNEFGQLGHGDTAGVGNTPESMQDLAESQPLPNGPIVQMALGAWHTCVLDMSGSVWCWGGNADGELGAGHTRNVGDDPGEMTPGATPDSIRPLALPGIAVKITAGQLHTCALLVGGRVTCWGYNGYGQLGTGDWRNRGDTAVEFPVVDLGGGHSARDVTASGWSVCAILENSQEKCWGHGFTGELGLGTRQNQFPGINSGDPAPWLLPTVDLGSIDGNPLLAYRLAGGWQSACAVIPFIGPNMLKCWGWNSSGQLGIGDTNNRGDDPNEMGNRLPYVGDIFFPPLEGRHVYDVQAFGVHTCVLTQEHVLVQPLPDVRGVQCWGENASGQLGLGDLSRRGDTPERILSPRETVNLGSDPLTGVASASRLATGLYHTCVALGDGTAKCWGYNAYGQLGLGDTTNRGGDPKDMGDGLPAINL